MRKVAMVLMALVAASATAAAAGIPEVGSLAPRIEIGQWLSGEIKGSGPLAGKTVVLEFFATWCRPCWAAIPHMNKLVDRFASDDVLFISMSHEDVERVASFMGRIGMKTRVVLDRGGQTHEAYMIQTIPFMVLIDNTGIIRYQGHPMALSEAQFESFLKGQNQPAK